MAERPHRDVVGGPRPDPGQREQRAAYVVAVGAAVEHDRRRSASARRQPDERPAAGARHRQGLRVDGGQRARRPGNRCVRPGHGRVDRAAVRGDDAPGHGARAGDADLLADHGAHGGLVAVDLARARAARAWRRTRSAERRVGAEVRRRRPRGRSRRRAAGVRARWPRRCRAGRRARTRRPRSRCPPTPGRSSSSSRTVPGPCGRSRVRAYQPGAGDLDARHEVVGEEVQEPPAGEGRADGQPHGQRPPTRGRRSRRGGAPAPAQLARRGVVDLADGLVELPHAGEPGGEGDVGERQVGGLDQHPGGLGATGAGQGERRGAQLLGRAAGRGGAGCSRPARRDRPPPRGRRARRRSAASPGRRRRRRRPTRGCRAWRRAGSACRRGSRRPAHSRPSGGSVTLATAGRARRAGRSAVDPGGAHRGVEHPVEAAVPALHRAVARRRCRGVRSVSCPESAARRTCPTSGKRTRPGPPSRSS